MFKLNKILILLFLIIISCIYFGVCIFLLKPTRLSINYLKNHISESGKLVYKTNPLGVSYNDYLDYNSLRHAGTLYSMYLCELYLKNYSLRNKRIVSSNYFLNKFVRKIKDDMYFVVDSEDMKSPEYNVAKLGGAGLALTGLSNLYNDKLIDLNILKGLGNSIIYMQKPNGSFYSEYDIGKKDYIKDFTSLYYPGEAILGLLYLYEICPDIKYLSAAKKGLFYLAKSRQNLSNVPYDHWALIATQKLFENSDNKLNNDERILLQKHTEQIIKSMINKQIKEKGNLYAGSFEGSPKSVSVATIMEGMNAAYNVTDDETLKKDIMQALDSGTRFLSKCQIKYGELTGGILTNIACNKSKSYKDCEIRIDNVQHVLSAWIMYNENKKHLNKINIFEY